MYLRSRRLKRTMDRFTIAFILTLCSYISKCNGFQSDLAVLQPSLSGFLYTSNLLFAEDHPSVVSCAAECLSRPACVTFSFRESLTLTSSGACREHSDVITSLSSGVSSNGAEVYQFPGRGVFCCCFLFVCLSRFLFFLLFFLQRNHFFR